MNWSAKKTLIIYEGFFYYQRLKLTSLFSDVHGTLHVSLLEIVNRRISARYFCL